MRKIVFFDIDGTIVTDAAMGEERVVPESAVRAIARAREKGNLCFINSGRPFGNIDKDILDIGFDGVISGCGTSVRADGRVIYRFEAKKDVCEKILEACKRCRVNAFFERDDKNYFAACGPKEGWIFDFIQKVRNNGGIVSTNADDGDFYFDKMCVFDDEMSDIASLLKTAGEYFDIIDRGGGFHELVPKGCSKGEAMKRVMEYYGIAPENSYAIGDSTNDIDMFNATPNSIAMGNGKDVHKYVSFVTKDILDDGIEYALKHFGII